MALYGSAGGITEFWYPPLLGVPNNYVLTVVDGQLIWAAGGGSGGTPGGSDTQVQFNDAGSFGGDAGLTYDKATDTLTVASLVRSLALRLTSTGSGVSIYNTADEVTNFELGSLAWSSNILRLGTSRGGTGVGRDVNIQTPIANLIIKGAAASPVIDYDINASATITSFIRLGNGALSVATSGNISAVISSPTMTPSGAGSANFRILNLSYTLNGTNGAQSGTGTGIFLNATETTLNGMAHNLADLQVGGSSRFSVSNAGLVISASEIRSGTNLRAAATGQIYWNGRSVAASPSDGVITLSNTATNDFSRLQLGGTTASFPSIKRNSAAINFRLADDSADANITAGSGVFSGGISSTKITKRIASTTDNATSAINSDTTDEYVLTAVANATTFSVTGTPTDGQAVLVRFKDAGVAKGLTWTSISPLGVTLPTTTVAGKWHAVGLKYFASGTTWYAMGVTVEA